MRKRALQRQVSPKMTAFLILLTLAVVQWVWWQGLVAKPKARGAGGGGGRGGGPSIRSVHGREDVTVDTLSGSAEPGDTDGLGRDARFDGPCGLALDGAGNLYVADSRNHRIRVVAPDGKTTTLAGSEAGLQDGSVQQARFNAPCGVAVAPDGAIYVADTGNHRIRCIRDGKVSTLAGGTPGCRDALGAAAQFDLPDGLVYVGGASPRLVVADSLNRRLRLVQLDGTVKTGGLLPGAPTSVTGGSPPAVAVPQSGAFFVGSQRHADIDVDGDDEVPNLRPGELALHRPVCLCPAPDGWFAADAGHGAVLQIHHGKAEVLAGLCVVGEVHYSFRDGAGNRAGFGPLGGIAYDGKGHVYVADTTNNAIRRITLPAGDAPGPTPRRDEAGRGRRDATERRD